jgi:glycosyltransferase involved in cell wall biosynthesis
MYNLSDRYVLLSDSFKPVFCRLNRVDGKKLTAIGNPCSFSEQYSEKQDKNNTVLVVSRMAEQQKRITEVLKIWKEANIPNWSLVLIGDGPDLSLYKRMAASMHLKNIEFLGAQKHPEKWYRSSKIFLMTSVWEGLSMTLLEAQHYGCVPIVYNSFSAVYDIIEDNKTGIIIQHNDSNGFADALRQLTCDSAKLQSMSKNAIISSNSKYDLQTILQQWEALFSSLDLNTSR